MTARNGDPRLIHTIRLGDMTQARELLLDGANPNLEYHEDLIIEQRKVKWSTFLLHEATGCTDEELVKLLVEQGADISNTNSFGATALHEAALYGNHAASKFLLEQGMKADALDNEGRTPLHEAAQHGYEMIVRLLIEHGASGNHKAYDGTTPTDLALDNQHINVAQVLLQHGASFSRNRQGFTNTRELAVWTSNATLIELLLRNTHATQYFSRRAEIFRDITSKIESSCSQFFSQGSLESNPQFCSTCQGFQNRFPSTYHRYGTVSDIQLSGGNGCPLCSLILDCLPEISTCELEIKSNKPEPPHIDNQERDPWQELFDRISGGTETSSGPDSQGESLNFQSIILLRYQAYSTRHPRNPSAQLWSDYRDELEVRYGVQEVKAGSLRIASIDNEASKIFSQTECSEDFGTGSDSAFALAGAWLCRCLRGHVKCNQYQGIRSVLPSRVIDCGPADGSRNPFLHSSSGQHAHYVTLSHRWGDYTTVKTTLHNLEERSKTIPMELLPPTFQDAVKITRKLGFRFLWIDTVCIVQDDASDWEREAAKMAQIFRNSILTIAASAENCYELGLFRERVRHRNRPCPLNLKLAHRQKTLFQKPGQIFAFGDRQTSTGSMRPLRTLDTRGWILQEQLLSPRVLYFDNDELFWECASINASESYPFGIPDLVRGPGVGQSFQKFKEAVRVSAMTSDKTLQKTNLYKTWRQVVHAYSRRELSVLNDRMVAMAGIVSETERMLNDRCVFGLWAKRLESGYLWQELLWCVDVTTPSGELVSQVTAQQPARRPIFRRQRLAQQEVEEASTKNRRTEIWTESRGVREQSSFVLGQAPTWSWYKLLLPISYEEIDTRDPNGVTCEASFEGFIESFPNRAPFAALKLRSRVTRMYPRKHPYISPIPESELQSRMGILRYAATKRTGVNTAFVSLDLVTVWKPDIDGLVNAESSKLWCLEIARSNSYQLCLGVVPERVKGFPMVLKRVGLCYWNMSLHGELPGEIRNIILI